MIHRLRVVPAWTWLTDILIPRGRAPFGQHPPTSGQRRFSDHAQSNHPSQLHFARLYSDHALSVRALDRRKGRDFGDDQKERMRDNKVGYTRYKGYRKLKHIGTVMLCISDLLVNSKLQHPFTLEKPQAMGFSVVLTNSNFFIFLYFIFKW